MFGDFVEVLRKLELGGRGLLCCRRGFDHRRLEGMELRVMRVSPEPELNELREYWEEVREERFDYVLAIGGGSVIDAAKVLAALMENPGRIEDFIGVERIGRKARRLIAVPTTHGTGSEVTKYSVIRFEELKLKRSVVSEHICPEVAVMDEKLMMGLPPDLTIYTSMDAFCHNVEAYLTKLSDPLVDLVCEEGIRLFFEGIEGAMRDELDGRKKMMMCSLLGGVAITNAQASLIHALSHVLGGMHAIPHGLANAIFLPAFLRFYAGDEKFESLQLRMGVRVAERIGELFEDYRLKRLSDFVTEREAVEIAERAFQNQRLVGGNRKRVTVDDMKRLALESM